MKKAFLILVAAVLGACGAPSRVADPQRFDFGSVAGAGNGWRLPLASIEVQAASWLTTGAMYYRLAYAEPLRRQSYTESRWAAPPAELLESLIRRRHALAGDVSAATGCRLQLALDELEQRFDSVLSSEARIEVQAVLLPAHGSDMLARRMFRVYRPASGADARSGVAAAREAALAVADELVAWTNELARDKPAVVAHCRN